jgi:hypothetical protein
VKIDWLLPCRFAESHADGTMTISGAGVDIFWLAEDALPSEIGLFLAMRIAGSPAELLHKDHELIVRLSRPDHRDQEDIVAARFRATETPLGGDDVEIGALIPMFVPLRAAAFGTYVLELSVDEEVQTDVRFHVRPQTQATPAPGTQEATTSGG